MAFPNLTAFLVAWAVLVPLGAQDSGDASLKIYSDRTERVRVPIPTTWSVKHFLREAATDDLWARTRVLQVKAVLPDCEHETTMEFYVGNGAPRNVRLQVGADAQLLRGQLAKDGIVHVGSEPVAHVWYVRADDPSTIGCQAYRRCDGRSFMINMSSTVDEWAKVLGPAFGVVAGIESDLPVWPPKPDGYEFESAARFEVAVDPEVSRADRDDVVAVTERVVRAYEARHGAIEWQPDDRPIVIVNPTAAGHQRFSARVDLEAVESQPHAMRILTTPLGKLDSPEREEFVNRLTWLLQAMDYPRDAHWLLRGQAFLAWSEECTGKALPRYLDSELEYARQLVVKLEDLPDAMDQPGSNSQYVAWSAFFLNGPKKYQDAYAATCAELRATYDPAPVLDAFVQQFDQEGLLAVAQMFVKRKLKPAKPLKRRR